MSTASAQVHKNVVTLKGAQARRILAAPLPSTYSCSPVQGILSIPMVGSGQLVVLQDPQSLFANSSQLQSAGKCMTVPFLFMLFISSLRMQSMVVYLSAGVQHIVSAWSVSCGSIPNHPQVWHKSGSSEISTASKVFEGCDVVPGVLAGEWPASAADTSHNGEQHEGSSRAMGLSD